MWIGRTGLQARLSCGGARRGGPLAGFLAAGGAPLADFWAAGGAWFFFNIMIP